jgi:hypothetical protein
MSRVDHIRSKAVWILTLTSLTTGCAVRQAYSTRTMPSPDECYLQVWDQPNFSGTSDFINGHIQYRQLRALPGRRAWKDRIRSLTLGPSAWGVAWSDEEFDGRSLLLTKDRGTFASLSMQIRSLDVRCAAQADDTGTR